MKLLYYIQAASLAVEGKRLFDYDVDEHSPLLDEFVI